MYLTPGFRFEPSQKEHLGFLMKEGKENKLEPNNIIGFQVRQKNTQNAAEDTLEEQETSRWFQASEGIVLAPGPNNKYWVLKKDGTIELTNLQ